jgi:hypothetical protein
MDISLITQKDTADCVIVDPVTGKDTDIVISLYGVSSSQYRNIARKLLADKSKDSVENDIEYLSVLTVGWKNIESGGKPLKFSPENARKVYEVSTIRGQVIQFIHDVRNFLPPR